MSATDDLLGEGWDHTARRVERPDGSWVVKEVKDGDDAVSVRREVAVMRLVGAHLRGRAAPAEVVDDRRLAYPIVPGVALLDLVADGAVAAADHQRLATELGRLIAELAAIDATTVEPALPVDDEGWAPWFEEVGESLDVSATVLSDEDRRRVDEFLAAAPPEPLPADGLRFTHNDLGAEHVLVDPATLAVTGIIDWTDAAIADPALDVGRLLRDLGAATLPAILDGLGSVAGDREAVVARARCAARLLIVEGLAFAIEHRPHLVEFERANLHRLFTP